MTIIYGTGFEVKSKEIIPSVDAFSYANISVQSGGVSPGSYHMRISDGGGGVNWVRFGDFSTAYTELYASVRVDKSGTGKALGVEFELTDGTLVGLRKDAGGANQEIKAYVDGVLVETSTEIWETTYPNIELYVKIGGVGRIVAFTDGVKAIDYSGNTKPTSATDIQYLRCSMSNAVADFYRVDNITVKTDGYPGDIRYLAVVPDGDSAVTWTPSSGGTNYVLIDEVIPSDADYVETAVNTNQDLYDLTDLTFNNAISHVVQWIRGFSTPSGGEFKMQIKSGATTSEESTSGLATSAEYASRILETDPNTLGAWSKTAFNAALAGQEAVVSAETVRVTQHIIEIAYNENISIGLRPLEMDVDLESGSRVWVTSWEDGSLFLKRLPSTLTTGVSFSFGAATENEVAIRTFYLSPYVPGFFGTASLNDIIYVYGRWNDGAVTHLEKSTDGGSNFTDIGDSATWTTGWVGGFFADDANTLYAFVNGGSRALYRSIDAGSNWTNLSSLPFDVDPGGVSKHPDGRILISNRDAGAQTAAYAEGPDYSSWIDATGSPSFPASTPGNGSNAVIWIT
jgi:hypothetical protein